MPLPRNEIHTESKPHRSIQLAVIAASLIWFAAANQISTQAARGLSVRLNLSDEYQLLQSLFLLFLLIVGTMFLQSIFAKGTPVRRIMGIPKRPSSRREWATGAAIGWSIVVLALLPQAVFGALYIQFWIAPRSFYLLVVNLVTVALLSLASEIGFRGFAFRRLIDVIGPAWATFVISLLFGIAGSFSRESTILAVIAWTLFGVILCLAWLRTHALWLGWGLHFAWIASLGILFGLPTSGVDNLASLVESRAIGRAWLTGGFFGIEAAPWTLIPMAAGIAAVVLVSSDWAWDYTRKPLIPAGYAMDVPPPAAHAEMERSIPPAPPALVQILPTTSQSRSIEPDR